MRLAREIVLNGTGPEILISEERDQHILLLHEDNVDVKLIIEVTSSQYIYV